jgi:hypothetical protein
MQNFAKKPNILGVVMPSVIILKVTALLKLTKKLKNKVFETNLNFEKRVFTNFRFFLEDPMPASLHWLNAFWPK